MHPSDRFAARLFQSREGIFGRPPTEYDQILRVRKAFEPYVNLWSTAEEWTESYEAWTKGSFLAIDAETLEADVERCGGVFLLRGGGGGEVNLFRTAPALSGNNLIRTSN